MHFKIVCLKNYARHWWTGRNVVFSWGVQNIVENKDKQEISQTITVIIRLDLWLTHLPCIVRHKILSKESKEIFSLKCFQASSLQSSATSLFLYSLSLCGCHHNSLLVSVRARSIFPFVLFLHDHINLL